MKNYLVIYEPGARNWSAFCPDVPGCVATGKTRPETERRMAEAITLHLEGLQEDREEIPEPSGIEAGSVSVFPRMLSENAGTSHEQKAAAHKNDSASILS